jgi:hypothetical protein
MKNKITTDKDNLARFKKTGELVGKKIECNSCSTLITCFGSNLQGKIEKFGSIENLLESFVCRTCKSASKPKKAPKEKKVRLKKQKQEEIKNYTIPQVKPFIPRDVFLKDAPDIIQSITKNGTCASPSYYLDHAKQCEGCAFYGNCFCTLKQAA